jgi:hypothetical protein
MYGKIDPSQEYLPASFGKENNNKNVIKRGAM